MYFVKAVWLTDRLTDWQLGSYDWNIQNCISSETCLKNLIDLEAFIHVEILEQLKEDADCGCGLMELDPIRNESEIVWHRHKSSKTVNMT